MKNGDRVVVTKTQDFLYSKIEKGWTGTVIAVGKILPVLVLLDSCKELGKLRDDRMFAIKQKYLKKIP